jgi:hypothetical protein
VAIVPPFIVFAVMIIVFHRLWCFCDDYCVTVCSVVTVVVIVVVACRVVAFILIIMIVLNVMHYIHVSDL